MGYYFKSDGLLMKKYFLILFFIISFCSIARADYQSTILSDSPTFYYRLNDSSGGIGAMADTSGNSHTGDYSSGFTFLVDGALYGDSNKAVTLDGSTAYAYTNCDSSCNPNTSGFTVEAWIKATATGVHVIGGKLKTSGDNFWIGYGLTSGKASFSVSNADHTSGITATGSITVNDGNWHHIVGVRDGSNIYIYVDGYVDNSASFTGSSGVNPNGYVALGCLGESQSYKFSGTIDEYALYLTALSSTRILAHYTAGASGPTSSFSITETGIDPHTSGIVLHLTGSNTIWDGTTIFTPSGSGVTKTSQSVTNATTATVTVTTASQSGTTTITESVTGTSSANTTVLAYKKILTTQSGVDIMILEPASWVPNDPIRFVFYNHGAGEDRNALLTDSLKSSLVSAILSNGYLLAGISAGENWGNQAALDKYITAFNYINSQYTLKGTVVFSQSMGGLSGLLTIKNKSFINVRGWIGIYPVCNLRNMYDAGSYTSAIKTAYGIASDGSDYNSKTSGHDPVLESGSLYQAYATRFYASSGDTVVSKSSNSDIMQADMALYARDNSIVVCSGNHGDPSHFQPSDFISFLTRAFRESDGNNLAF